MTKEEKYQKYEAERTELAKRIRKIMRAIGEEIRDAKEKTGMPAGEHQYTYRSQRRMIEDMFKKTGGEDYSEASIHLRLVVIDSLYSTNAGYSYFSFEEMARAIKELGTEDEAREYFADIARNPGKSDVRKIFSPSYGIQKDGTDGSKQISLLSKYAYYCVLQDKKNALGFPIYDKLAREMFNKLKGKMHIEAKAISQSESIAEYIKKMNALRVAIFGGKPKRADDKPKRADDKPKRFEGYYQQYDILDAYLWRMGKISNGNFSLLLSKEDYEQFIDNIGGLGGFLKKAQQELREQRKNTQNEDAPKNTPKSPSPSTQFDKAVKEGIKKHPNGTDPFAGMKKRATTKYMKALLEHWRELFG